MSSLKKSNFNLFSNVLDSRRKKEAKVHFSKYKAELQKEDKDTVNFDFDFGKGLCLMFFNLTSSLFNSKIE